MARRLSPVVTLTAGAAIMGLALSGCGSNSLSTSTSSTSAPAASQSVDAAIAAALPAKIKSAGKIVVGVDTSYPPNEFLNADGKTAEGWDVDLFNAVAQKFGVTVDWTTAGFDSIILGVGSGKFDVGVSSFSVSPSRLKQATMVGYYDTGTQWIVPKGNPKKVDFNNACGLNVGVQKGTVQIDDLTARSKKCTDAGKKPINQIVEELQVKVNTDVVSGKADAMAADSPVGLYAVKQTNGAVEPVGASYGLSLIHISEPTRQAEISYAVFCLKKKK